MSSPVKISSQLPRLLYVGDVPIEPSYHGSALLYRLLQEYPPEKLRIVETNLARSRPERRLRDVTYTELRLAHPRPLYTRFARAYRTWLMWRAAGCSRRLLGLLSGFQPQAVLTVTHGFAWRTAARFAAEHNLQLHLICHDDLPCLADLPRRWRGWLEAEFANAYRQAKSRLCVSPFMRDAYRERYGVPGEVLYPSRAPDAPVHISPPERLRRPLRSLTAAFGGTINSPGCVRTLRYLAETLSTLGGRLLIFGPLTVENARRQGLDLPNVELRGLVTSTMLMERFREEVDVLFVPMSFEAEDRPNMEISFPSKLTDYTVVGLPLLIYGPEYCSAVRWARENPGVADVVTTEGTASLLTACRSLLQSQHRWELGIRSLQLGNSTFSHARIASQLFQALALE